jgi:hypothetical protein
MKRIFTFLILLILCSVTNTQSAQKINKTLATNRGYSEIIVDPTNVTIETLRSLYLSGSIGVFEVGSFGIGFQINKNFSCAVIGGATWIGGANYGIPNSGSGYGVNVSYYKKILFFNNISFDYIFYLTSSLDWESLRQPWRLGYEPTIKGYYCEVNLGHQNLSESGLNFFWSVGLGISSAKESSILFAPTLKLGINYNFLMENN